MDAESLRSDLMVDFIDEENYDSMVELIFNLEGAKELLEMVLRMKETGNCRFRERSFESASLFYGKALKSLCFWRKKGRELSGLGCVPFD